MENSDSPFKVFNDPIHGHIELPPLCVKIIDTSQFQRLRHIKQMGGNCFVYPGATHTRFEHSLGVCHLAGEMVEYLRRKQPDLNITDRDVSCVQVAGLCHDLGHGPFSHLFDGMFIPTVRPVKPEGPYEKWEHEDASVMMLDHLIKESTIQLGESDKESNDDLQFIKALIVGPSKGDKYFGEEKHFLYQIIANKESGIDVDKWDYFARDSYHLGISTMFDHMRLMKFSRVIVEDGRGQICFRDKEVGNIYDMFHTRQILHRRACFHKTTVIVEIMIKDAFVKADNHIKIPGKEKKLLKLSECIYDEVAYTRLTDHIYNMIVCSTDSALDSARNILLRLEKRRLYRCVAQRKPADGHTFGEDDENDLKEYLTEKGLDDADFVIKVSNFQYAKDATDPVKNVLFYTKANPMKANPIAKEEVSMMLPSVFQDQIIRVFCRSEEEDTFTKVKTLFNKWAKDNSSRVKPAQEDEEDKSGSSAGSQ